MSYKLIELYNNFLKVYEDGLILVKKKNRDIFYEKKYSSNGRYLLLHLNYKNKARSFLVHRIIAYAYLDLDITDTLKQIDHIDRCKSNNKVCNLRIVTHQENNFNRGSKGYYYDTKRKHFIAQIFLNNKRFYLGSYKTAEEAHSAYLNAKLIYHVIK
jgi:hypothetical protein